MQRKSCPSDLSEELSREIQYLLPQPKTGGRPAKHDRIAILNAILYLVCTGCAWPLLSLDLPHWKTVYHYFRRRRSCEFAVQFGRCRSRNAPSLKQRRQKSRWLMSARAR
jgi:transposase